MSAQAQPASIAPTDVEPPPAALASPPPEEQPQISWPRAEQVRDPHERQRIYRVHYDEAKRAFQSGKFEGAAQELLAAYQLEPAPIMLFNAAQAMRKAGKWGPALALYQLYVQQAPRSPLVPEAEANSLSMRAKLEVERLQKEQQRLSSQIGDAEKQAQRRSEQAETLARDTTINLERENKTLSAQLLDAKDGRPIYKRKWFWLTISGAAVVAAVVTTGIVLGTQSQPAERMKSPYNLMISF